MQRNHLSGLAAAAALVALPALAGPVLTDTDDSGGWSIEEMIAAYGDEMTSDLFETVDVDESGEIDADEVAAATESGLLPE